MRSITKNTAVDVRRNPRDAACTLLSQFGDSVERDGVIESIDVRVDEHHAFEAQRIVHAKIFRQRMGPVQLLITLLAFEPWLFCAARGMLRPVPDFQACPVAPPCARKSCRDEKTVFAFLLDMPRGGKTEPHLSAATQSVRQARARRFIVRRLARLG